MSDIENQEDEIEYVEPLSNDHLILVNGPTGTGKSTSLMPLKNDTSLWYLNCESNKKLPFKAKFYQHNVSDPFEVYSAFESAKDNPEISTIVIDTLTFLMEKFESQYVIGSANGLSAWSDYAQFYKNLMQVHVAGAPQTVVILAHTSSDLNETEGVIETSVPVKGALKKISIESFFSCIVSTKRMAVKDLKKYENPMLTITEEDEDLGIKYVFQTRITKDTINERIRGPIGMWSVQETFIDNNIQYLIDRLNEYYGDDDE